MRLPKPFSGGAEQTVNIPTTPVSPSNKRKKIFIIVAGLILLIVIAGSVKLLHHKQAAKLVNETPSNSDIGLYQNSTNLQDRRILANAYVGQQDYDKAVDILKDVASKSNDNGDYITILNTCINYKVTDKTGCINFVSSKMLPIVSKMDFGDAYSMGSLLDQAKHNKDAAVFYQRAYDVYDAKLVDKQTMTPDQLKARIAVLKS